MNSLPPRPGGTLRLRGAGDLTNLDPAAASSTPTRQILRLFARQLFTYRAEPDLRDWRAIAPVPDLAADIPSTYNAGLGASHLCYVVHLRRGVRWDTTPPREVTAHDVVRGFKRLASPLVRQPALPYYTSTIRGMADYHAEYAAAVRGRPVTAALLAAYQNTHDIPGVYAVDDETLVIELQRPALDFVPILAMTCVSPAPVEYDAVVPGDADFLHHVQSTGPYRPVAGWAGRPVPGGELLLERNPVWRQDTDPVRHQHVDWVHVRFDGAAPEQVARLVQADRADLAWGGSVAEPYDAGPDDPGHGLGYALDPYLVFNVRSPRCGGALANPAVRRALSYAIDKAAVADLFDAFHSGTANRVAGCVVPPGNDGHQPLDPYATAGGRGDADKARTLLAEAGYPDGLTLTAVHLDTVPAGEVAHSYAADLERAGVAVSLVPMRPAALDDLLRDPARGAAGEWDLTTLGRSPDWFHHNGRVFLQPMFATGSPGNPGGYHNPEVDRLIDQALGAAEPWRVVEAWQAAERLVMHDAAVVPMLFQTPAVPPMRGRRVRDALALPALAHAVDLSAVRLDPKEAPAAAAAAAATALAAGAAS
jgi:peptide/nickel transport system substrate-binding protein